MGPLVGLVLAFAFLALTPDSGRAQDEIPLARYNGWKVQSFKIEGVPENLRGNLIRGTSLQGKWRLLRGQDRPDFSVRILAEDLARIRLYLARHGYPAAVVDPVIIPDERGQRLDVVLRVDAGNPVRVGRIDLKGWPAAVAPPDTTDPDVLRPGEIFSDSRVATGKEILRETLMDAGFAEVKVDVGAEPMARGLVAVTVAVEAGSFYRIAELDIVGCSEDLVPVARRVLNLRPGDEYSRRKLRDASLDLRSTQLFRLVVLETEPIGPGDLKVTAQLDNNRMKTLETSVGTWSDNPWMVKSSWTHRNLFGGGVGFDVRGVVATHRLGVGAGVFWLGWLSPRAKTTASAGFLVEDEDAYISHEAKAEIVQSFRPRKRDIWNIGISVSSTRVDGRGQESTDLPEEQGRLLEFWTDKKWDRTDNQMFPTQGGYIKVSFTAAPPGFFSEIPYISAQGDAMLVQKLSGRLLVAGRMRVGAAEPLGEALEVIATRRFFAGGYNTHRGYGRRKLGPRDASGNARGGEFVALAGAEVRFPLVWEFDGAVFVDAGQLWATPQDAILRNIPLAVGASVDIRSPLGPVRVGYAHNFANLVPGEPIDLWHFGIGYPW